MKKILVWESHSMVSGGQKMTLLVTDLLKNEAEFFYLVPEEGELTGELKKRGICYYLLGNQSMPAGIKSKKAILAYAGMSSRAIFKAISIIRMEKPDIIYAPGPAALPWSAICGNLTRKPVIWHLHHVFLDGPTRKLLNMFSRWNSVRKIIAVSKCVADQIDTKVGKDKTCVIYNPVDVVKYSSGDSEKVYQKNPELDREHSNRTIAIGHIALVQETKRQSVVIQTVSFLKSLGYDAYAVLVGGVKNEDDKRYLKSLLELTKSLGCEKDVFFLGYREDVPDILQCVDLLMIPSAFEGFPLAGLEANAAGRPVVCADRGGSLEYAMVSNAGEIFEFDNSKSAAEAVVRCISNYKTLSSNGLETAKMMSISEYRSAIIKMLL